MRDLNINNVEDDVIKLIANIETIMENSECVHLIREHFKVFSAKYPDKWKDIKDLLLKEMMDYYEI